MAQLGLDFDASTAFFGPSGSSDPIRDVSAAFCDADGPMPSGPREAKRLNVAWITDEDFFIVERSRGIVDWAPGRSGPLAPQHRFLQWSWAEGFNRFQLHRCRFHHSR